MISLVHDLLAQSASRLAEKVALVCQGRRVTFGELHAASDHLAALLRERGVGRGDRVAIFADNSVETVVSFWATSKAGAVATIVHAQTKADKLAFILSDCEAKALVVAAQLVPIAAEALREGTKVELVIAADGAQPEHVASLPGGTPWSIAVEPRPPLRALGTIDLDVAMLIYTSGTTGEPKGVMHSHRSILTAATSIARYLENHELDVLLCVLPLAFGYGMTQLLTATLVGARLVLERSFAYPAQILNLFGQEKVTGFAGIPTAFGVIGELKSLDGFDLSSLRYMTSAAAALSEKHVRMLRQRIPQARLFVMYGQTECLRATYLPPEELERRPHSMGIAIPNTEAWVADERGERVPPGVVGELVIRGSHVMKGYFNRPEETKKKLHPGPTPGELVLRTGDLCKVDEDGFFTFVSRSDDIIKCRGEKVSPKEVENALLDLEGIRECAVIGVPDELLGEAVKAFCVLEEGANVTERQIAQHAARNLEGYMVPKLIEIVSELPKTSTGKITKAPLRERARG